MAETEEVLAGKIERMAEMEALMFGGLSKQLSYTMVNAWHAVEGVDNGSLAEWLTVSLPLIRGVQLHAASITAGHLAGVISEMRHKPPIFLGIPEDVATGPRIRRGTSPADVYSRPIIEARALLDRGLPWSEAMRRAGDRAVELAVTDLQSTRAYSSQYIFTQLSFIQGYRRVLRGPTACGLCVVASTRRYRREDLLPRHPGCHCGVVPIFGDHDPGEVINRGLLESMHTNIEERFGKEAVSRAAQGDEYRTLVEVYAHGEYGPTLVRGGDRRLRYHGPRSVPPKRVAVPPRWPTLAEPSHADISKVDIDETTVKDWRPFFQGQKTEEIFEVDSGPTVSGRLRKTPGPGYAYLTKDGRLFYAEFDEHYKDAARQRLETMITAERQALPKGMTGSYAMMSVKGVSTQEIWVQINHPGAMIGGTAAEGGVTYFRSAAEAETIWHETGHIVGRRLNERYREMLDSSDVSSNTKAVIRNYIGPSGQENAAAPGEMWQSAARLDERKLAEKNFRLIRSPPGDIQSPITATGTYGTRAAITEYAADRENYVEDLSESWRLLNRSEVTGKVGDGVTDLPEAPAGMTWEKRMSWIFSEEAARAAEGTPYTFQQLYPNRYRYIQKALQLAGYEMPPFS